MAKQNKYIPLHVRHQQAKDRSKATVIEMEQREKDITLLYRTLFESESGQLVLQHMVESYLSKVPSAVATPNEVMFGHGQAYVVHDILRKLKR